MCTSITCLTVCCLPNFNRSMKFLFLTAFEPLAIRRV